MPLWSTYGEGGNIFRNGLSSFISDLPEGLVSYESIGIQKRFSGYKQASIGSDVFRRNQTESSELNPGDKVKHPAFGPGVISKVIADNKVEVFFRNVGRKLLHLEYTTLEKT